MKRNSSGFTLTEILLAIIIGVFLVTVLYLFTTKLGKLQKTVSTQKELQTTGEKILNDIAQEVYGAQRINSTSSDELVLTDSPIIEPSGTITYNTAEYPEGGVNYARKTRVATAGGSNYVTNYLGDPQQVVNVEAIKFYYYTESGAITSDWPAVRMIKTTISLNTRLPDKTNQRLKLSGTAVLHSRNNSITHGEVEKNIASIRAKVNILIKRAGSTFAAVVLDKRSTGLFTFKLPVSISSQDTYSITAEPQIADPLDEDLTPEEKWAYKAVRYTGCPDDYTSFLSEVGTLAKEYVERSFKLETDQTKFTATGEIKISDVTVFDTSIVLGTYEGPVIPADPYLIVPAGSSTTTNNYPDNDFHPCGRLTTIQLTGAPTNALPPGKTFIMHVEKISDGVSVIDKTVTDTDNDGQAQFTFDLPLPSYENPADGFAKIAAFKNDGGWTYQGLVTSRKISSEFKYSFPESGGGAALPKSASVSTIYMFIFLRVNTGFPLEVSAAPETLYRISVDGSTSTTDLTVFEPGKGHSYTYTY